MTSHPIFLRCNASATGDMTYFCPTVCHTRIDYVETVRNIQLFSHASFHDILALAYVHRICLVFLAWRTTFQFVFFKADPSSRHVVWLKKAHCPRLHHRGDEVLGVDSVLCRKDISPTFWSGNIRNIIDTMPTSLTWTTCPGAATGAAGRWTRKKLLIANPVPEPLRHQATSYNNNNNNNTMTMVIARVHSVHCRTAHKRSSTLRPIHLTWAVSTPVGSYRLQPPSPFIIITQPQKLILIYLEV